MSDTSEAAVPIAFDGKKCFLHTFILPQQVALPHPLIQKDQRSGPASPDSDELLHSSSRTLFKSQCNVLKNATASPSAQHVFKDSAFTTAVHACTGKCLTTRHALFGKFTRANKSKLQGNPNTVIHR